MRRITEYMARKPSPQFLLLADSKKLLGILWSELPKHNGRRFDEYFRFHVKGDRADAERQNSPALSAELADRAGQVSADRFP